MTAIRIIDDHIELANIGSNTHEQIDNHIASTSNPHGVTKAQIGLGNVEDGAEINVQSDWNATDGDALILNKPSDVTDLSGHSVTELSDITSVGSGAIISANERTKLGKFDVGTAAGQIAFWNGSTWTYAETSEMFWDDTNKGLGLFGGARIGKTLIYPNGNIELAYYRTGDRYSCIDFHSDDVNNDYSARIIRSSGENGVLSIMNKGTGNFNFTAGGSYAFRDSSNNLIMGLTSSLQLGIGTGTTKTIGLHGGTIRVVGMERNTTADSAGYNLILNAGGATSAATDKAGGDLILEPGISTGSAESGVQIRGCVAGSSGTEDRTMTTMMRVLGNKIGFYNVTPTTRQVLATGASATVDDVITVLQTLGLVKQS